MRKQNLVAVDLFCGIGGLTYGFKKAGIDVVAGIDSDESCKYAYEINNSAKFICKDISDVTGKEINKLYPRGSIRILVGCAPCQTFSQHTQKNRNRNKDERWFLLYQFLRIVKETKPDIISMENVPQLKNYSIFKDFVNGLKEEKYSVFFDIINSADYGIPQSRKRLVLLASKFSKIKLIDFKNNDKHTVRDAIGNLPKIRCGECDKSDSLHRSSKLNTLNMKRIRKSKPGGTWLDWDKDLRLRCHKKKRGLSYKSVYGRMSWDKPSPTITTEFYSYGTGRFGHPSQNRAISLREGALLQTFPINYKFIPDGEIPSFTEMGRHIGNAVPVKLGKVIGKSIKNHIKENQYE